MVATLDPAKVVRVLELELERGCTNGAVVGGLDRMFIQMAEDGALTAGSALRRQVAELSPSGYRGLAEHGRRTWLTRTIAALQAESRRGRDAGPAQPRARRSGPAAPEPIRLGAAPKLTLESPATQLPGIGKAGAARLEKLGVVTAGDAAQLYPRRFNDFTDMRTIAELQPGRAQQTVVATVFDVREMRYGRRVKGAEAVLQDRSGALRCVWFNQPFVARALTAGEQLVVSGRVRSWRGRLQMENPEFEPVDAEASSAGRLVPIYPATQGLSQKTLRRAIAAAVEALADQVPDAIPRWLRESERLEPVAKSVKALHYPRDFAEAEAARRRVALGEFTAIQSAVLMRRARWQAGRQAPALPFRAKAGFIAALPFPLTRAQSRTMEEILRDIGTTTPMLRLLQGDVGSGKTVVAFAAMFAAVQCGYQAALMAPTEILAEQHHRSLTRLLGGESGSVLEGVYVPPWLGRPLRVVMLTGSLTTAQKQQVRGDAAHGGADIIIGTHALLEDDVALPRLGLAVADEQHRFGVVQRLKLRQKGANPHLLVMTATPIPRTLALTVYGDLEVSTIDEMPPGRKPIKTSWVPPHDREEAYDFLRARLRAGEQAYVICPLVDESESLDLRSAEEEYERLRRGPLAAFRLDLLHGRMSGRQKDEVMARFAARESDVLVSTSVIEVGIDVPNATVMVIEGAERFGLSQLHQFRGRVGRSPQQSYCMLFSTEEDPGPDARERLEAMVDTTDGFKLAEVDLEMRGEGEAWGTLQSGTNTMLRVAKLTDRDILTRARMLAEAILARDPSLQKPEHRQLAAAVYPFLDRAAEAN
jgi:ATP-dependent DNA helicase RecG